MDKALLVSEIFCHFRRPFLVDNILVDNKNESRVVTDDSYVIIVRCVILSD